MVESCVVMVLLCLILFGILQTSIVTAAHDVFYYAASAGVRCKTVGYDQDMVRKSVRIASLPALLFNGNYENPARVSRYEEEILITRYLSEFHYNSDDILFDYVSDEFMDSIPLEEVEAQPQADRTLIMHAEQRFPLVFPFVRSFYAGEEVVFSAGNNADHVLKMEDHAALYLYD